MPQAALRCSALRFSDHVASPLDGWHLPGTEEMPFSVADHRLSRACPAADVDKVRKVPALIQEWQPIRPLEAQRAVSQAASKAPRLAQSQLSLARPAGFELATRCLEGTVGASRDVAWRRSTSHLPAVSVADRRRMPREICLRWLPGIYFLSLKFE
jgi:hypothetical protein